MSDLENTQNLENTQKGCFPKLKQLWKSISCKSKCSNCVVVKQANELKIEIDDIEQLKDLELDIPFIKQNNIKISFV